MPVTLRAGVSSLLSPQQATGTRDISAISTCCGKEKLHTTVRPPRPIAPPSGTSAHDRTLGNTTACATGVPKGSVGGLLSFLINFWHSKKARPQAGSIMVTSHTVCVCGRRRPIDPPQHCKTPQPMIIISPHPSSLTSRRPRSGAGIICRKWQGLINKLLTIRSIQTKWHVWGTFLNRDVSDFVRKRLSEVWLGKPRIKA